MKKTLTALGCVLIALCAICVTISDSAFAVEPTLNSNADNFRNFYPSSQDVAEDCSKAIKLADEQDYKSFMQTACVARIHGIVTAYTILIHMIDAPENEETKAAKKIMDKVSKRICIPDLRSDDPPIVELKIARDYVNYVHSYQGPLPLETYLNKPSAMHMGDMLQANCNERGR